MSQSFSSHTLRSSLRVAGPRKEIWIASLGCLLGSTLLLLAVQLYQDGNAFLKESEGPRNYFTLNKKIEGGAIVNLGKSDQSFDPAEIDRIKKLEGVRRVGGFTRNRFPLTLYIWPSGKVGLGAAAKTDLFFESIPDEFLDFVPEEWQWDDNSSTVPIMVPKFYLDLWNFGLAPSRVEYPALSTEAATGMPIELYIGKTGEVRLMGRFVAFSKRINSVLVPESFLKSANEKYGQADANDFFFLWKNGAIEGPPISRSSLASMEGEEGFDDWEVSPLENPAERAPASETLQGEAKPEEPSRIILEVADNPSDSFLALVRERGYEINREFPEQDLIKKAMLALFLGIGGIGALLSLLSIATFATSFRLVVTQASEQTGNLLLLGFSREEVGQVFLTRFLRLFLWVLGGAILAGYACKWILVEQALRFGVDLNPGVSLATLTFVSAYALLFLFVNKRVIKNSVEDLVP